jgi:ribosomal subunit interface protein
MQVLVNSDHHIKGSESLADRVETIVSSNLDRFADRITRVEVHLSDTNSDKRSDRDKRCMMEARVGGLKPIAVSHEAPTVLEAIDGAVEKLERALEHALGRLDETAGRSPAEDEIADVNRLDQVAREDRARRNQ